MAMIPFEDLWHQWLNLAHQPRALEGCLAQDLAGNLPRPLEEHELATLCDFVREFAQHGVNWIAQGTRGDEVAGSLGFLAPLDPRLHEALLEKVQLAEYRCWLGGSVDQASHDRKLAYTRFVVASASRSGTHLLRTLLASHPCIEMHGESFNTLGLSLLPYGLETGVDEILSRHVFRPCFDYVEAVGFLLFRNLDARWAGENVWQKLATLKDLKVILLERANHLERLASLKRSLADKVWYVGVEHGQARPAPKVTITPDELLADIALHEGSREQFMAAFQDHPILPVTYESLVGDIDAVAARAIDFLGVHPCRLVPGTGKKESRRIEEVVANYEELRQHFEGTPHARLFAQT